MKAIINGRLILENEILEKKAIVFDEKIIHIGENEDIKNYELEEIIDAKNAYVCPGFIDIHIHGSGGRDTMEGSIEALEVISRTILKNGVTSFLPTTMTMEIPKIRKAMDSISKAMKMDLKGARILGAHMEGPFINAIFKGAQNPQYIIEPDYSLIEGYEDVIKIITLAPEVDKDFEFIKKLKKETDITISMGHTNTDFKTARKAIESGISHATHLFNAMTGLHHREPGAVGAIFSTDITTEFIADKIHINPDLFPLLLKIKGSDQLVFITDSMSAGCMKEGIYDLGGQEVVVDKTSARLKDGTLAGSILKFNEALKNMKENSTLNILELVKMATIVPAKVIKVENEVGSLEVGKKSDIIFIDENFGVERTIVEGQVLYIKK